MRTSIINFLILTDIIVFVIIAEATTVYSQARYTNRPIVHISRGDKLSSSVSWDQINGEREIHTASIGFLFRLEGRKYIPSFTLSGEHFDLLIKGYTVDSSDSLEVEVISVEPGSAAIKLGDLGTPNFGVGIRVKIAVQIPEGCTSDKRSIVMKFPNVLEVRDVVGAKSPVAIPSITFKVTNFKTENERAASRWWQNLLFGTLCLIIAIGASLGSALAFEEGGIGCGVVIIALLSWVGSLMLLGDAINDLNIINAKAKWIIAGIFILPLSLPWILIQDTWPLGLCVLGILLIIFFLSLWNGWANSESAALVLLPGSGLGAVVGTVWQVFIKKKNLEE